MISKLSTLAMVLIVGIFAMALSSSVMAAEDSPSRASGPQYDLPTDAKQCIRPTEYMRKNHMVLLLKKRDQTMRKGIRTTEDSLQNCVACHANKDEKGEAIPVNAPGQFCAACHEYASIKLDCFECHRATPDVTKKSAKIPDTPEHKNLVAQLNQGHPLGQFSGTPFSGLQSNLARYVGQLNTQPGASQGVKQ